MQAEDVADDEETATDEGRILKRAKIFFCDSGVGDLKLSTVWKSSTTHFVIRHQHRCDPFLLSDLVWEVCKKFVEGSESSEPSDEECEDYDDLDMDGLSNQAAEMDLEGWNF